MPDFPVPLVGPTNRADYASDPQRSINLFPRKMEQEGEKTRSRLVSAPGLGLFGTLAYSPIRGLYVFGGRLFAVAGAKLLEVYSNATVREWGSIGSVNGRVSMAELGDDLVIGDGAGFVRFNFLSGLVTAITDAPIGRACIAFGQRILYHERASGRVYYSELNDATDIPGVNFFTAENRPDDVVTLLATEDQVWLPGLNSTEVFYDSGDADTVFQRIGGSVVFNGCEDPDTFLRCDNSIFWVGRNEDGAGLVYRSQGFNHLIISTGAISRFLETATGLSAYSYQEDNHTFVVINADQGTRVYDVGEKEWHERGWLNLATGEIERSRAEIHAYVFGKHIVSDYETGALYEQSTTYFSDAGNPLVRRRIFRGPYAEGRAIICDELFIDMMTGVGLDGAGQGTDPVAMLRYSDDGGELWSNEIQRSIGKIGQRETKVRFHGLGLTRDRVFEFTISDPVDVVLLAGIVRGRVGRR